MNKLLKGILLFLLGIAAFITSSLIRNIDYGLAEYEQFPLASQYFKIDGYPVEIFIDKQGKIRNQFAGYNKDLALIYEKNTLNKIDALLNED